MTWLELAERCRNATGPDREIDALIGARRPLNERLDMVVARAVDAVKRLAAACLAMHEKESA